MDSQRRSQGVRMHLEDISAWMDVRSQVDRLSDANPESPRFDV